MAHTITQTEYDKIENFARNAVLVEMDLSKLRDFIEG